MERIRRLPAIEKNISDITEEDRRIKLLGTLVNKDLSQNTADLDDGTGTIHIFFDDLELVNTLRELKEGSVVRVIGRVRALGFRDEEKKIEIEGEVLQPVKNLKIDLYKKVLDLEKKIRGEP
jgi:RPA family protein